MGNSPLFIWGRSESANAPALQAGNYNEGSTRRLHQHLTHSLYLMSNPWTNIDAAFDTMFADVAEFRTNETNEVSTLKCCIFPREVVDPFVDSDNQSNIKEATIIVKKCDWIFTTKYPAVGDQVRMFNGDKYKVATIDTEQNWYRLTGRSF